MLVLSRVVGEMISIGDNITVRILAVNGNHVRFGVEAPKHVNVHRAEIYRRILTKVEPGVPLREIRDPVA